MAKNGFKWLFSEMEKTYKYTNVRMLAICPSHFCLEHISKSIEGNLMKFDTLIVGHEENCRMQEP